MYLVFLFQLQIQPIKIYSYISSMFIWSISHNLKVDSVLIQI